MQCFFEAIPKRNETIKTLNRQRRKRAQLTECVQGVGVLPVCLALIGHQLSKLRLCFVSDVINAWTCDLQ